MSKVKIGKRLDHYDREIREATGALKTVGEIELGLRVPKAIDRPAGRVDPSWDYRLPVEYRR